MFYKNILCNLVKDEKTIYLYSETKIREQCNKLLDSFQRCFSDFNNYYAVKANSNPNLIKIILESGMGLDCSSLVELELGLSLVGSERIIYTSNYTSKEELRRCVESGVRINLDDYSLIDDLRVVCEEMGVSYPEFLYLRVNPGMGRTDSGVVSNVLGGEGSKFGIPYTRLKDSIELCKSYGCKSLGLHVMTGSNILDIEYYFSLIERIGEIIKEVKEEFVEINLGGGLGIPYKENEMEIDLDDLVEGIKNRVDLLKVNSGHKIKIVMENGRYIMGQSGFLLSEVQVIKESFGKKFIGLNACMSNLMRPGMYNAYHKIINFSNDDSELEEYQIVGNLCENNDWFGRDRVLQKTKVGDIIMILDVGAHSYSMGFQYNGKLRCSEYLMNNEGCKKIRRKETIEDYLITIV